MGEAFANGLKRAVLQAVLQTPLVSGPKHRKSKSKPAYRSMVMRFIWNFFFFGILFYLIWMFFPDAFMTLVSWANHVVAFFKDLFTSLWEKIHPYFRSAPETPAPKPEATFLMLLSWLKRN